MGLAIEREEWLCVKLCDPPFLWSSTIKRPLAQLLLANLLISCSSSGRSVQIPKGNWVDMSRSCNFRSLLWTQGSTRGHPRCPWGGQARDVMTASLMSVSRELLQEVFGWALSESGMGRLGGDGTHKHMVRGMESAEGPPSVPSVHTRGRRQTA